MPRHLKVLPKNKVPTARKVLVSFAFLLTAIVIAVLVLCVLLNVALVREGEKVKLHIAPGASARTVGKDLRQQGLLIEPNVFVLATYLLKVTTKLKAGYYEIPDGLSTYELARFLSEGKGLIFSSITLVEGLTTEQFLTQLRARPDLIDDLKNLTDSELAQKLRVEGGSLEGWIHPETYKYTPNSKLSDLLVRAVSMQQHFLLESWNKRTSGLPLKTPYEALKLASIVEKETGQGIDRSKVASVFMNRLKKGMLLQTDPTVIYGLRKSFDGNLTRLHLRTDTPYNSYKRAGLPPTPIANPGKAAIHATLNPEESSYYYFVSKGDGSSHFSQTLREHNRAVRQYQLRQ